MLRNISRNLDKINYPDEKDKVSYLSVKYSLPEWLVKQWLNVYDEGTVKTIGSAFLEENPLTVRFNEHKIKKEDLVNYIAMAVQVRDQNKKIYTLNVPVEGGYKITRARKMSIILPDPLSKSVNKMQKFIYGSTLATKGEKEEGANITVGQ